MAKQAEHHGVFSRTTEDGRTYRLVASSPADAVKYRYDGWAQVELSTEEAAQAAKEEAKAAKAAETATDDSTDAADRTGDVAGDSTTTKGKTGPKTTGK